MKSAYELAMERLSQGAPAVKLTAAQKKQIAELETRCKARVAEREIATQPQIAAALAAGEAEKAAQLEAQLATDRRRAQAELEEKKKPHPRRGQIAVWSWRRLTSAAPPGMAAGQPLSSRCQSSKW